MNEHVGIINNHRIIITYLDNEIEQLVIDYDNEVNIGRKYEILVNIVYLRRLRKCEYDLMDNEQMSICK